MRIDRGFAGGYYVVFEDESAAYKWHWLFGRILRRPTASFGAFENAYYLFGGVSCERD